MDLFNIGLTVVLGPVVLAAVILVAIELSLRLERPKPAAPWRAPIYLRFGDVDRDGRRA